MKELRCGTTYTNSQPAMKKVSKTLSIIETPYVKEQHHVTSFLTLFEKCVNNSPNKTAVKYKEQTLSYIELSEASKIYAHTLSSQGVKAGSLAMVALTRSIELIPLLIAIMRVGATYIPIDINHPVKSIERIVNTAKPDIAIFNNSSVSIAENFPKLKHFLIDDINAVKNKIELKDGTEDNINDVENADAAYIIYTSGSTGTPKGVRIPHQALSSFLIGIQKEISCGPHDRFAALTTISFDISGLEMYLPLTLGATVIIIPQAGTVAPNILTELLDKEQVSVLQATPATYRMLMHSGWHTSPHLKKILCGGEALSPQLSNKLLNAADEIWNVYGPTEATIWATIKKITEQDQKPVIGKPLAGYECLILDEEHKPTMIGQAGELYISSECLAKDYYNDNEKTNERFFNILANGVQKRVYKTGDKALINSNGDIEYLGRLDFQVKVRGYRVELPEIEKIALTHPEVIEFTAITTKDTSDENIIKGFYTLKEDSTCTTDDLHKFLSECLAHYMLPSMLHPLDKMPLNTNGKIDRKALANINTQVKPNPLKLKSAAAYSKDFDFFIYRAWCNTLGIDDCEKSDNFFLLGGHSITAIQFIKQVDKLTNTKVPLGLLFKEPKLNNFLNALRQINSQNASIKVPLNKSAENNTGKQSLYFVCGINIYQHVADSLHKSIEAHAIYIEDERKLVEEKSENPEKTSTQKLASIYVESIINTLKDEPISLCGISYGGLLAIEIATQLQKKNINVNYVYMLDSSLPGAIRQTYFMKIYRNMYITFFRGIEKIIKTLSLGSILKRLSSSARDKYSRIKNDSLFEAAVNSTNIQNIDFDGEVVLMTASDEGGSWHRFKNKPDYGWQQALNKKVNTFKIPGDHLGIINKANAINVANIINEQMTKNNE